MALKIFRIIFPIWLTFILFGLSIFFIFVPALKQSLLVQKKLTIKDLVDSSCSIFSAYQKKVEQKELHIDEARQMAISHIENLRYGPEGKDYFWIIDMHPFMIMHPYRPDLDGRDLTLFKDVQGNFPFMAMVETVMQSGSGYVNYSWQWKDTPQRVVPKISYVKGFKPWGLILGTGIYTQDVDSEIDAILKKLSITSTIILFIILGISLYLTRQSIRIERERIGSIDRLQKSEALHRRFIDNAPVGMYTINLKGEFTYINKKFESITGYRKEDWLNKAFDPIIHPEDIGAARDRIKSRLEGKGSPDPYEIRIFNSGGEIIWINITSESIYTEEGGTKTIAGMQSFVEEVTRRKAAEASLKFSEGRLKAILEANPDPMVVYDLVGHPQYLNPAFVSVFGWTLDELKHKTIPFVPEDQKQISSQKIKEIFDHGKLLSFETRRYTKNGQCLDILLSAAVNKNEEDDPIGMVVNLTDITEKKALEAHYKQAQKMESIGTLTGGIAHDFNNILNVILGHSELALGDCLESDPVYASLKKIREAGLRAADIVRQLLSFSRRSEQEFKVSKLSVMIDDSLTLLRSLVPSNIEIKKNFLSKNDIILADPVQINQVVMNLCINASHEMEKDGGILGITLENFQLHGSVVNGYSDLKTGPYVKMAVSDTGAGIDPQHIDRIFDPYFTTKGIGKGSGMGLSVVHGIVKTHNGAISVSSEPGMGTTFNILFPVIEEQPGIEKHRDHSAPHGNGRIPLVDDDEAIAEIGDQLSKD